MCPSGENDGHKRMTTLIHSIPDRLSKERAVLLAGISRQAKTDASVYSVSLWSFCLTALKRNPGICKAIPAPIVVLKNCRLVMIIVIFS